MWAGDAWTGGWLQLFSHAFAKAGMFMAAGLIADATGRYRVDELGGVARIMPLTALAFAVCGLSLAGIPPGGGFSAKWMLLVASLAQGQWLWAVVILAGGLIAAAYVFMVIGKMLADPPAADAVFRPVGRLRQVIPLALGLVAILLGALPMQPLELLGIGRPGACNGGHAMTMDAALLGLAVATPLAMLAALLGAPWSGRQLPMLLALAPVPAGLAAVLAADGTVLSLPGFFAINLALDRPGALLLGASALLWSVAGLLAPGLLGDRPGKRVFAAWWLLTLTGSMGVFVAADLVTFYLFFTIVSLVCLWPGRA